MNWKSFEQKIKDRVLKGMKGVMIDPAHDDLHLLRVVELAKSLAESEGADLNIVVPAAWMHDFIIIPKNDPRRTQASRIAAQEAILFLETIGYSSQFFPSIAHAIESHSFSAGIEAKSLEAKVVQDADRLDGLGAIGIARCFATAGVLKRAFYSEKDPFCKSRHPTDQTFTVDHFYQKLYKTASTLNTSAAQEIGKKRMIVMQSFLAALEAEIL